MIFRWLHLQETTLPFPTRFRWIALAFKWKECARIYFAWSRRIAFPFFVPYSTTLVVVFNASTRKYFCFLNL